MKRNWEKCYPYFFAAAGAVGYWFFGRQWTIPDTIKDLLAAMISVAAISAGFLTSAKAILFALEGRNSVSMLKQANLYEPLIGYFMAAIHLSFALAAISAVALMIKSQPSQSWMASALATIWVFCLIGATLSYIRVVKLLGRILLLP